jgi:hypothetical protein
MELGFQVKRRNLNILMQANKVKSVNQQHLKLMLALLQNEFFLGDMTSCCNGGALVLLPIARFPAGQVFFFFFF